jgi:hypothetical protein
MAFKITSGYMNFTWEGELVSVSMAGSLPNNQSASIELSKESRDKIADIIQKDLRKQANAAADVLRASLEVCTIVKSLEA